MRMILAKFLRRFELGYLAKLSVDFLLGGLFFALSSFFGNNQKFVQTVICVLPAGKRTVMFYSWLY